MGGATGANTIVTPADFGNPIVRCTDLNTGAGYSFTGNWTSQPASAGFDNVFNINSTFVTVIFSNTETYGVIGFDPTTQQCNPRVVPGFKVGGLSWSWSRVNTTPGLLYHLSGTQIVSYTFSDGKTAPSGPKFVFDFSTCPGFPRGTMVPASPNKISATSSR